MKLVIIGGDAAGMSAASRARRLDPRVEITVLEQTMDVSYSACGMPYNIADPKRTIDDLVVRKAEVFRQKSKIDVLTGHRADALQPADHSLTATNDAGRPFTLFYDKLMIATGARPIIPNLPGIELPGVLALKSLEQGRRIKQYIADHQVGEVLIIGMGYIALEMCEALRQRHIAVTMVKPRPELLPWLPREMADVIARELDNHQVKADGGNSVKRIEQVGPRLKVVGSKGAHSADMVLVAMGVQPNSELAAEAGLALGPGNAIAVDRGLQTSNADIFAAGDCADAYHVVTGAKTWIPLALRANRAGWAVADRVCGKQVSLPGIAGTAVFKVFDLEVARTGLTGAEAKQAGFDPADVTISTSTRAHAHPGSSTLMVHMVGDKKSGRVLGAQMVGREGAAHRINAVAVALHAKMTVEDFIQCDLSYAPPFGPVWDPLLTTANQLVKAL